MSTQSTDSSICLLRPMGLKNRAGSIALSFIVEEMSLTVCGTQIPPCIHVHSDYWQALGSPLALMFRHVSGDCKFVFLSEKLYHHHKTYAISKYLNGFARFQIFLEAKQNTGILYLNFNKIKTIWVLILLSQHSSLPGCLLGVWPRKIPTLFLLVFVFLIMVLFDKLAN